MSVGSKTYRYTEIIEEVSSIISETVDLTDESEQQPTTLSKQPTSTVVDSPVRPYTPYGSNESYSSPQYIPTSPYYMPESPLAPRESPYFSPTSPGYASTDLIQQISMRPATPWASPQHQ